jgi:ketol-acid reductoisomerase
VGLYESLDAEGRERFEAAYNAAYIPLKHLTEKIYADVSSGREIAEVIADGERNMPMTDVDATPMWQVGSKVRANHSLDERRSVAIDPEVAGIYVAGMMAQVNTLRENGHAWSEVVNESIIEAVDSLNPYMQARGLGYMVDNCSVTARRGDRAWASRYRDTIERSVLPVIDHAVQPESEDSFAAFLTHQVHQVLSVLGTMRPPIRIAVQ